MTVVGANLLFSVPLHRNQEGEHKVRPYGEGEHEVRPYAPAPIAFAAAAASSPPTIGATTGTQA
jgi:hypothetical protein